MYFLYLASQQMRIWELLLSAPPLQMSTVGTKPSLANLSSRWTCFLSRIKQVWQEMLSLGGENRRMTQPLAASAKHKPDITALRCWARAGEGDPAQPTVPLRVREEGADHNSPSLSPGWAASRFQPPLPRSPRTKWLAISPSYPAGPIWFSFKSRLSFQCLPPPWRHHWSPNPHGCPRTCAAQRAQKVSNESR